MSSISRLSSRGFRTNLICRRTMASSTPANPKDTKGDSLTDQKPAHEKEPWYAHLANWFGRPMQHADSSKPPIPLRELRNPNVVDWATGEEKLLLLAFENGVQDPYCLLPIKRSNFKGTKDDPIKVPGFFNERLVACECEPNQNFQRFMILHRGEVKRCKCGYHHELVDIPPFWQKIPKEELLEIAYFRGLEEDGILDDFLSGKLHAEIENQPKIEIDEFGYEKKQPKYLSKH